EDAEKFLAYAAEENLEAVIVARVTREPRLVISWHGKTIVDLSRDFLNSNGATKYTDIEIEAPEESRREVPGDSPESWNDMMADLNVCSQKGLVEKFDSTIGAGTVLMPYGGAYQMTPSQAMAAKIPVLEGETDTCSLMGWGYNPNISSGSPYHGALLAVVESIAKVIAAGGKRSHCWLTFQEYFERTQNDPKRWGKPLAALLGAYKAQLELGCGSIGGKDSMSGTFEHIDVPPTLVSFAVSTASSGSIVSTEFKKAGDKVILLTPEYDGNGLPNFDSLRDTFNKMEQIIADGRAKAVWAVGYAGVAEGIAKMCMGNKLGFTFSGQLSPRTLFTPCYGSFIVEIDGEAQSDEQVIGQINDDYKIYTLDYSVSLESLQRIWEEKLESVFPCRIKTTKETPQTYAFEAASRPAPAVHVAKPRVLIPVFPGTNCEYDTARAFEKAGAVADILVLRNLSASDIADSVKAMEEKIANSQIIMIPGGFSGGDEPEGSGKFITAFFRNPEIKDAVHAFLNERDGLMLGICNGFQALIKLGLVPFGEIVDMTDESPTLTFNTIARHQSMMVNTRIASNKSP
ncbi:MAG: phosphoribosylformylglycinamidine synthase subunit PurQ, partial [Oscillospiraceae bacterium]|nr:phosphoribosylformylglycinamidine synthase subunit PurQ [Oscillospiraceae bacterium]